jgi:hypothetical protein
MSVERGSRPEALRKQVIDLLEHESDPKQRSQLEKALSALNELEQIPPGLRRDGPVKSSKGIREDLIRLASREKDPVTKAKLEKVIAWSSEAEQNEKVQTSPPVGAAVWRVIRFAACLPAAVMFVTVSIHVASTWWVVGKGSTQDLLVGAGSLAIGLLILCFGLFGMPRASRRLLVDLIARKEKAP